MKPEYNSPAINHRTRFKSVPVRNTISLLRGTIDDIDSKHDIVLNISVDKNLLIDFFRYIGEKTIHEEPDSVGNSNESPIVELTVSANNPTSELWINEKEYLTCREVEIMERLSKGRNYKEIADELGITFNTVRNHLQHIYPKLGIGNRSEAVIEYLKIRKEVI